MTDDRRDTHTPEHIDALIACCLEGDAPSAVAEIERHGLWEYVAARACFLEVGGALSQRLRVQGIDVAAWPAAQLEAYRDHLVAANAYKRERVAPMLARLQHAGIPFLLLKGAALAAALYEDAGARAMVDVDVLIRPDDAHRAHRVLIEAGCTPGADLVSDDFYPHYYYEREYLTPQSPSVKIDLHVRPFRPLPYARTVPDDALWHEPAHVAFGPLRVPVPNAQNMLIHLAVHAASHGAAQLKWLYDIHQWLERFGDLIDGNQLAVTVRQWRVSLPVQRALQAVERVFETSPAVLPDLLISVAQPATLRERLVLAQAPRDADHPLAALFVNLLCTPGLRFRLGYLKAVALPGRAHLGQLYPRRHPGWPAVAHLVRLARGLARPFLPAEPEPA